MVKWHLRSKRKTTGGLRKRHGKKKKFQRGRDYIPTLVGKTKVRKLDTRGGGSKFSALTIDVANVMVDGKAKKAKILHVVENPANAQFVRRNIITKGAVVNTDLGKARITSRPTQDGTVDAVLIEKK